ncbi:hypothetical protein AMTRI_Chr04g248590 [Amborella trichopoda]
MLKAVGSKGVVIRINLVVLALFLVVYATLFFWPTSSSVYLQNGTLMLRPPLPDCLKFKREDGKVGNHDSKHQVTTCVYSDTHIKAEDGSGGAMKAIRETHFPAKSKLGFREDRGDVAKLVRGIRVAMVNLNSKERVRFTKSAREAVEIKFERVSSQLEWTDLFPEWIDEEEENDGPSCPEIPMPDSSRLPEFDAVVARLPCSFPEVGWARDVFRLQVHLVAAKVAARSSKKKVRVVLLASECRPMLELFRCDDMVNRVGEGWVYEAEVARLRQKLALPVGSCRLALPLWKEGSNEVYELSRAEHQKRPKREAYATVLHSSDAYVCGAIALAQSLLATNTTRNLIILVDKSISEEKREGLRKAGWQVREIKRIRNPRAQKHAYNEYNYSKFRLWKLTDYDKIIFVDADMVVLKNMDHLFAYPQMSATGNDGSIFNSGVMAIEPSNCTFRTLMSLRKEVVSYNGGDQGFLNEVFTWWHRWPRRVNFLKNFWSNKTAEVTVKTQLFGAEPPKLYGIHYLGLKPWLCYRDYDCNWNVEDQHVYASNVAHRRWWRVHDAMEEGLQGFCVLTDQRKIDLEWDRMQAGKAGFSDGHWRLKITDPRRHV